MVGEPHGGRHRDEQRVDAVLGLALAIGLMDGDGGDGCGRLSVDVAGEQADCVLDRVEIRFQRICVPHVMDETPFPFVGSKPPLWSAFPNQSERDVRSWGRRRLASIRKQPQQSSTGPATVILPKGRRARLIESKTSDTFRIMMNLHIRSVGSPFDDPTLATAAIGALSRADAMGLLSRPVTCLDDSAMQELGAGLAEAGVGQAFIAELRRLPGSDPDRLSSILEKISEALDQSPAPMHEWRALQGVLGLELLTRLLGISQASARRYLSGNRSTPDTVAARLHFLALVVGDLAGAYNDIGVRRWFDRRRTHLNGETPAQALGNGWSPEDNAPRQVRELARALTSFSAT